MSSIIKVNTVQDQDGNNIINENANTITIGKSGDTVQVASGASLVGAGIEWQSTIVTGATHTVSANQGIWIDTSSNACTLTLPASPSVGDQVIFTDYARNWGSNAVTLNLNSEKFQGNTTPVPIYDTTGESVNIVYSGSTKGWIPNSDGAVALETPQTVDIEYLAVAGGGSGGRGNSGGAGAGGLLTNFGGTALTINTSTVLTVTVGAGGAAISGSSGVGNQGANSTISGPGISTVTAIGGGAGGRGDASTSGSPGGAGGSGGGSGYGGNGGAGTSPQGNNGGSNNPNTAGPKYGGSGGGGAGAVGSPGSNNAGGAGGNGSANSITGSSVTYAGGGGGSVDSSGGGGAGGSGGGGAGSYNVQGPGTDGLGGGGGGTHTTNDSGKGGDGVVILTMPDADYSSVSTGSPTVATNVGGTGKTTVKFTGNGTYTV
jgi:hypothetical protein